MADSLVNSIRREEHWLVAGLIKQGAAGIL
jgi:hypothetical protein